MHVPLPIDWHTQTAPSSSHISVGPSLPNLSLTIVKRTRHTPKSKDEEFKSLVHCLAVLLLAAVVANDAEDAEDPRKLRFRRRAAASDVQPLTAVEAAEQTFI